MKSGVKNGMVRPKGIYISIYNLSAVQKVYPDEHNLSCRVLLDPNRNFGR